MSDLLGVIDDSFSNEAGPGVDSEYVEVPKFDDKSEEKLKEDTAATICTVKFMKLRKAANNLKWRAKNIDTWDSLAEEYRVVGERLMSDNMYLLEQEEYMTADQQAWYDCQLNWWSNNLQNGNNKNPEHCVNQLEHFQRERKVVNPKYWWNNRLLDEGNLTATSEEIYTLPSSK